MLSLFQASAAYCYSLNLLVVIPTLFSQEPDLRHPPWTSTSKPMIRMGASRSIAREQTKRPAGQVLRWSSRHRNRDQQRWGGERNLGEADIS
jgi:hypothetical protein